jgi:hypothetical protein
MIPQLSLERASVRLVSYNARTETHGKEEVPACDLIFEGRFRNDILVQFGPEMRAAFFRAGDVVHDDSQGELGIGEQAISDLPILRNPKLPGPFKLQWEGGGYQLTVDYGLGERSNIELDDCRCCDMQFTPHQGGEVDLRWRIAKSRVDERARGVLSGLVKQQLVITLECLQQALPMNTAEAAPPPAAEKPRRGRKAAAGQAFPDAIDGTGKDGSWPASSGTKH